MPYGGGYSYLSSKNNKLNRYNFIKNSKKGAILIEFAFAVPVLFSLIYYISDLATYKSHIQKMEFCTHCMVNILQNISQQRSNKAITKQDFIYATYAAFNCWFGGDLRQYGARPNQQNYYYFPHPILFCVKGLANGKAKILWLIHPDWYKTPNSYNSPWIRNSADDDTHTAFSTIKMKLQTEVNAADITPRFSIKEGEIKMILEGFMFGPSEQARLGFSILKPRAVNEYAFYNKVVIFTPKPGLFSETPPQ